MRFDHYKTSAVKPFLPTYTIGLISLLLIHQLSELADHIWQKTLIWAAVLLVGGFLVGLRSKDVILTPETILEKSWSKKRETRWNEITQVVAFPYDGKPALLFIRPGGYKMREEDKVIRFYIRNIGKLICVPDNRTTRQIVAQCYGPLDLDLSKECKNAEE